MTHWSDDDYKDLVARGLVKGEKAAQLPPYVVPMKQSKYHNERCEYDGIKFASKMERKRYIELVMLKEAKVIADFELQPEFELTAGIKYRGDFLVTDTQGKKWVEDTKGVETPVFKLKKKLFEYEYPDIELRVIK